jgi:hypothetical protein
MKFRQSWLWMGLLPFRPQWISENIALFNSLLSVLDIFVSFHKYNSVGMEILIMNDYYTYVLIDPRTCQPFYVGKGKNRRIYDHWKNRKSKHVKNEGLKNILCELDNADLSPTYIKVLCDVDEVQALNKEKDLVALYGRLDIGTGVLYNKIDGGEAGSSSWSPATREAKRTHELSKRKGLPVTQYALTGEKVVDFPSAKVASETVPSANRSYITQVCKGIRKSAGGFQWTYKDAPPPQQYSKEYYRPVHQYDAQGLLVKEYRCVSDAAEAAGVTISTLSGACSGVTKTCVGFVWCYADQQPTIPQHIHLRRRKVLQHAMDGRAIKEYNSAREASTATNIGHAHILRVCSGRGGSKSAGGFVWSYVTKL